VQPNGAVDNRCPNISSAHITTLLRTRGIRLLCARTLACSGRPAGSYPRSPGCHHCSAGFVGCSGYSVRLRAELCPCLSLIRLLPGARILLAAAHRMVIAFQLHPKPWGPMPAPTEPSTRESPPTARATDDGAKGVDGVAGQGNGLQAAG
jgi:hypothetical protein